MTTLVQGDPGTDILTIRPANRRDHDAIASLANRDRVSGQPQATSADVKDALAGRSPVDAGWWKELTTIRSVVACSADGTIVGAASTGVNKTEDVGYLLWLHANEDPVVVEALLDWANPCLAGTRVQRAFWFACALHPVLEGLPSTREVTRRAVAQAGYAEQDLWSYRTGHIPTGLVVDSSWPIKRSAKGATTRLEWQTAEGEEAGHAEYTVTGTPKTGSLEWISVNPPYQGSGIGRKLLTAALADMFTREASHVVLVVDDDAPGTERDRGHAKRLYDSIGVTEVARLLSYETLK